MEEPLVLEWHDLAIRSMYNETKTFLMKFISYNCLHISELLPQERTKISSFYCKFTLS